MVLGITSTEPTTYLGSVSLNLGARGEGGIGIERKRGIRVEEKNGEGIERKGIGVGCLYLCLLTILYYG